MLLQQYLPSQIAELSGAQSLSYGSPAYQIEEHDALTGIPKQPLNYEASFPFDLVQP
jgi:hypothetical protein